MNPIRFNQLNCAKGKSEVMKIDAIDFLMKLEELSALPMSTERACIKPTKAEVKRWLKKSSVIINNKKPKLRDRISLPVIQLIFFQKEIENAQWYNTETV